MNESVKVSYSTVQLRKAKQRIYLSRSNWLGVLLLEREIKLHTFLWDNRGPGGRKDVVKGLTKVIPNPFKVVQTLLNIAVIVSLRDYWHFLKELSRLFADMRLNHASPRALPVLYNYSFLFWDRVTLYMLLNFEWSRDSPLVLQILQIQSFPPVLVMSCYTRQEELRHLSVHSLTCRHIGHIMNHNIKIFLSKVKLCKTCL